MRRSYAESFTVLAEAVEIVGDPKPDVARPPRHDDADFGPSIFRALVASTDLSELTLPGLYVGRSELRQVFFADSDLHLSTFNWNDLVDCSFYLCDLSGSDLRACVFERCSFTRADLSRADLRHSTFGGCDFTGANLAGATLHDSQREIVHLSEEQAAAVVWTDAASEPAGG